MGVFDYLEKEEFTERLHVKFYLMWGRWSFWIAVGSLGLFILDLLLYFLLPGMAGQNIPVLIPSMLGFAAAIVAIVFSRMGRRSAKARKVKCAIIGTGMALAVLCVLLNLTLFLGGILWAVL